MPRQREISKFSHLQIAAKLPSPLMQHLIRFVQQHPTFRIAELKSCFALSGYNTEEDNICVVEYDDLSPFCVVELSETVDASKLVSRSILVQ